MLESLFQSTTMTALEQVVNFTQARHTVLAGNIANIDTPGYQARDLSVEDFQQRLRAAIEQDRGAAPSVSPGEPSYQPPMPLAEVAKTSQAVLRHDLGNVGMEAQASEMAKNQMQHNLALSLLINQFHELQAVVSEKA